MSTEEEEGRRYLTAGAGAPPTEAEVAYLHSLRTSKISKTTVTFTVLHRTDDPVLSGVETIGEYSGPADGLLGYVMQESWDGGMVGSEGDPVTVPVPDDEVEKELLALGNDGTFFEEDESDFTQDNSIPSWPREVTPYHLAADADHLATGEDECGVCGLAVTGDGRHGFTL